MHILWVLVCAPDCIKEVEVQETELADTASLSSQLALRFPASAVEDIITSQLLCAPNIYGFLGIWALILMLAQLAPFTSESCCQIKLFIYILNHPCIFYLFTKMTLTSCWKVSMPAHTQHAKGRKDGSMHGLTLVTRWDLEIMTASLSKSLQNLILAAAFSVLVKDPQKKVLLSLVQNEKTTSCFSLTEFLIKLE